MCLQLPQYTSRAVFALAAPKVYIMCCVCPFHLLQLGDGLFVFGDGSAVLLALVLQGGYLLPVALRIALQDLVALCSMLHLQHTNTNKQNAVELGKAKILVFFPS